MYSPGYLRLGMYSPSYLRLGMYSPGYLRFGMYSPGYLRLGLYSSDCLKMGIQYIHPAAKERDVRNIHLEAGNIFTPTTGDWELIHSHLR
jgi:hypothetical protein